MLRVFVVHFSTSQPQPHPLPLEATSKWCLLLIECLPRTSLSPSLSASLVPSLSRQLPDNGKLLQIFQCYFTAHEKCFSTVFPFNFWGFVFFFLTIFWAVAIKSRSSPKEGHRRFVHGEKAKVPFRYLEFFKRSARWRDAPARDCSNIERVARQI